jgi:hypothetical protein
MLENAEGAIQNGQYRVHKTQDEDTQNKNTKQYVSDTTLRNKHK